MAAGGALAWCGGSPACVRTANDGPLQVGKKKVTACLSDRASAAAQQPPIYSHKAPAGWVQLSYFR